MDAPASFAGTIGSFSPGDTIDLAGVTTVTGAVIIGDTLTVSLSSGGPLVYPVSAPYAGDHLKVTGDGGTGTDIIAYGLALPGPQHARTSQPGRSPCRRRCNPGAQPDEHRANQQLL